MDIQEIRQKKINLECEILKMIFDFSKETKIRVVDITVTSAEVSFGVKEIISVNVVVEL